MSGICRQLGALVRLCMLDLYRRKDLVVVLILAGIVLGPLLFFRPFGIMGATRYTSELALLLVWVFSVVIGLGVGARQIPPELESRTIYPLLARPVSRSIALLGKYLGALAASLSTLLIFYLAYAVLHGCSSHIWFPVVFWQALLLHAAFMVLVTALALLGSLVFSPSANLTLCGLLVVGMLVFGQRLPALAATQSAPASWVLWLLEWVAPHLEFFDMRQRLVHEWPAISWRVCGLVWVYALCYTAACLALATRLFERRRF